MYKLGLCSIAYYRRVVVAIAVDQ